MKYYKLLQLEREPFSNSPDPNYFFHSRQHLACLQKIELAVRLKRGLNVIIGHMGTGKTTLCRELIRRLAIEDEFDTYLILDPAFNSTREFLETLYEMIYQAKSPMEGSDLELKEALKQILFKKGVDQQRTSVLIIDEGQKITSSCVEILRELLNYETNEFKLLQIVIFAQNEFEEVLERHPNFSDRVNILHHLEPMGYADTCRMIRHRLKLASTTARPLEMFTKPALWAIYRASRGYPRRIIHLCHQSVLTLIIQNRSKAGWRLIQSCRRRMAPSAQKVSRHLRPGTAAVLTAGLMLVLLVPFYWFYMSGNDATNRAFKVPSHQLQPSVTDSQETDRAPAASVTGTVNVQLPAVQSQTALPITQGAIAAEADALEQSAQHMLLAPSLSGDESGIGDSQAATDTDEPKIISSATGQTEGNSDHSQEFILPESLGRFTIHPGDTLSGMIITVYGTFRNEYLSSVLNANPHIQDADNIQLGDTIELPVIEFQIKQTTTDCHWIRLGTYDTLAGAMTSSAFLKNHNQTQTRIMGRWIFSEGLRFEVLVQGYFANRQTAERHLYQLPVLAAEKAAVISGWAEGTHLFSDPYAGGIRKPSKANEA